MLSFLIDKTCVILHQSLCKQSILIINDY